MARDPEPQRLLGKVAYRGGYAPAINDRHESRTCGDLGLSLDASDQTPDETVDEIVERAREARVG